MISQSMVNALAFILTQQHLILVTNILAILLKWIFTYEITLQTNSQTFQDLINQIIIILGIFTQIPITLGVFSAITAVKLELILMLK